MRETKVSDEMPTGENEERLISYLLGELSEAESTRIEEEYLADENAIAPLLAIEAELYDAYARNCLSAERRRLFEQRFLATPEQRWQLEFSRTLLRVPRPAQTSSRPHSPWPRFAAFTAVAAAIAIAIALRWFPTPRPELTNPQITPPTPEARPQVILTFELGSGITRDGTDEQILEISANTDLIRIAAEPDFDLPESYTAVLRKPEGDEIWRNEAVRRTAAGSMNLEIPATLLSSGHYVLSLYGTNPNGTREDIGDYAFRVLRK